MFSFFSSDDDPDVKHIIPSSSSEPQNVRETEIAEVMMNLRGRIPQSKEDSDKAEKALAKELANLSYDEREKILFQVHGVSQNKSIAVSEASLAELHEQLLLVEQKEAYERALHLNRAYVERLKVMFLHAEDFDAKKAAGCLVLHFQEKKELFVPKDQPQKDCILARDVTWADLDEEDRLSVMSGFIQMSPKRDASGRTIIFLCAAGLPPSLTADGLGRAVWYVLMSSISTEPDLPRTGSIIVGLNFRDSLIPIHLHRPNFRRYRGIPNKTVAVHFGYRSALLHTAIVVFRLLAFAHGVAHSARFRFHYGNMEDISFEMQTFGIPMDVCPQQAIPGTDRVGVSVAWHLEWLRAIQAREQKEMDEKRVGEVEKETGNIATENAIETVIIPRRYDVLFGKSKAARDNPGSLRCRHLVRTHWQEYEQASRRERTKITDMIIATIHESGGRFLRPRDEKSGGQGSSWVVVEHDVARAKVSHLFRHIRQEERIKAYNKDKSQADDGTKDKERVASLSLGKQNHGSIPTRKTLNLLSPEPDQPCAKQRRTTT